MATGNVQIQGNITGLPTGSVTFGPLTSIATAAIIDEQTVSLSSGANTITLPSGITTLIIVGPNGTSPQPNPLYGGTLTLKGVSGDTGIAFSAKWPLVLQWDTTTLAPASIIINASTSTTCTIWTM